MKSCVVCFNSTDKYKCPTCSEPYCSLNCWKQHKESQCQPLSEAIVNEPVSSNNQGNHQIILFPTEDTVPREKLEQLCHSDGLKEILRNKHLRQLLNDINSAPNAVHAMNCAMQEPLFLEFADECLKVVEDKTNG